MDNPVFEGQQELPAAYDYRMYDQIWKRVSPDLTPYPDLCCEETSVGSTGSVSPAAAPDSGLDNLPGAIPDPCCMGTQARDSLGVLAGFIDEEMAESRYFRILGQQLCSAKARKLLQKQADEKMDAARQLRSAYYLITGTCHTPAITVETRKWQSVCQALRFCYHQEACNGLNYQRAGEETTDLCLQKMLSKLSQDAYQRAETLLNLLSTFLSTK